MAFVYSCCFWFSLRLGGILIGLFSIIQASVTLVFLCEVYSQGENVKKEISSWMKNMNLIYISDVLETFLKDPEKYIQYLIIICCGYILICCLFMYGAYTCNNILMVVFILVELIRLIILSIILTTWLLILKQNTMDIGVVIGASVAVGFFLLGMFYLWVCAANLPILVNEMKQEQQQATINRLQQLLEKQQSKRATQLMDTDYDPERNLFVIPLAKDRFTGSMKTAQFNPFHTSNFIH